MELRSLKSAENVDGPLLVKPTTSSAEKLEHGIPANLGPMTPEDLLEGMENGSDEVYGNNLPKGSYLVRLLSNVIVTGYVWAHAM